MNASADYIEGGRRCAVRKFEIGDDWWVGTSPRNGDGAAVEGSWSDWVALAEAILERNRATQNPGPITDIAELRIPDLTDEEADSFIATIQQGRRGAGSE